MVLMSNSLNSAVKMEHDDDGGTLQVDCIMERLRSRISHQKTWLDATKALRIANTERTSLMEVTDKLCLQKHLEKLQEALRVTALNWMVERLEAAARQCSLQFRSQHGGAEVHLSSDMFWIQVLMEVSGRVKDVRIICSDQTERCPELAESLSSGNFSEFHKHLHGLVSMYQVGAFVDKKQKTKMCLALQSVEKDLKELSQMQKKISGVSNYVHKTPLGILLPRRGGRPMKLTYYVAPYDLLNKQRKAVHEMTIEEITENELGHSVTVGIDSSPHKHHLQTIPLMNVKTQDGRSLPSFSGLNQVNSTPLPATFVLHLQKPLPLSMSVLRKIQSTTGLEFVQASQARPLLSLLVQQDTEGKVGSSSLSTPLCVSLPDQNHGYFVGGLNGTVDLMGVTISKIPFCHPTHVPVIIQQLRQQICFNTVLSSCIRPQHKQGVHGCLTFEVTPVSLQHLTISFEHPVKDSIALVELDLSDVTNIRCRMSSSDGETSRLCSDEQASKLMQRSMSLPITMRSIMKTAAPDLELQIEKLAVVAPPPVLTPISRLGFERRQAFIEAHNAGTRPSLDRQLSMHSMTGSYSASNVSSAVLAASMEALMQGFHDPSPPRELNQVQQQLMPPGTREDKASKNPMLASLLDQESDSPESQQPSMLSQLLNNENGQGAAKPKKPRKRKSTSVPDVRSPGSSGRSPKRKPNEEDFGAFRDFPTMEMDMSAHNSNSHEIPNMGSQEHQHFNVQRSQSQPSYGNASAQESHVSRLASTVHNFIKQEETKNLPSVPQPGMGMPQPPPSYPMMLPSEIKQEQSDIEAQAHNQNIKREFLGQSAANRLSKGNSLADLLKTDSPTTETEPTLAPPAVSPSLVKKEFTMPSRSAIDKSVGLGSKSHKSFDSVLPNSSSKSQEFKRSNSVEILDSPPNKVKSEGSKSVNTLLTKNSISREKPKFPNEKEVSNFKSEDKQGGGALKDRVKKEKREDDQTPRLTLKLNTRDFSAKKESTPSSESGSSQDPFDHAKAITPKEPSRLGFKDKFGGKDIYDLVSDPEDSGPLPQFGHSRASALSSSESGKPSSPSVKIRKSKSEDANKLLKRKSSTNKHDGEYSKKKRKERESSSDGRKEKVKKKKVHDGEPEFGSGSGGQHTNKSSSSGSSLSSLSGKPLENKSSTTIRISTLGGKLQITPQPNSSPSNHSKASPKGATPGPQGSRPFKTASSTSKLNRPPSSSSSKQLSRSKSDPHGSGSSRMDSKLTSKTTVKLKPVVTPGAAGTVTVNASGNKSPHNSSGLAVPSQSGSKSASIEKTLSKSGPKPPLQKPRKPLTAVIDSLKTKQKQPGQSSSAKTPPSLSQKLGIIEKRSSGKADKFDSIRKEILMAGQGPAFKTSQKKSDSSRSSAESGFPRMDKSCSSAHPAALPSTPIPKISKTSPLGVPNIPIPKLSSSSGSNASTPKSMSSSSSAHKHGSSGSSASRPSSSGSAASSDSNRSSSGSKDSSYSSKGPSGALGGNHAGKVRSGGSSSNVGPSGGTTQASLDALRKDGHGSSQASSVRKSDHGSRHGDNRDNHSPIVNAQKSQSSSRESSSGDDAAKRNKLDELGDRAQGRHFLDALGSSSGRKGEGDGKADASRETHKSAGNKRPPSTTGGGENSKSEQVSGPHSSDKSRINGLNTSGNSGNRNSPKESSGKTDKHAASSKSSDHSDRSGPKPASGNSKHVNSIDHNHRTSKPHANQNTHPGNSSSKASSRMSPTASNSKLTNCHGDSALTNSNDSSSAVNRKHDSGMGSLDNKENTSIASPDPEDRFKAPTPKTSRRDESDLSESRPSRLDRIKPIRSPGSNPSSPEDSLVIDCPTTPNSKPSKSPGGRSTDRSPVTVVSRSPVCTNAAGPPSGGAGEIRSKSPAVSVVANKLPPPQSPSVRKPILTNKLPPPASPSPPKSPMMQHKSPVVAKRRESPVDIDDDLMDEAITM